MTAIDLDGKSEDYGLDNSHQAGGMFVYQRGDSLRRMVSFWNSNLDGPMGRG